MLKKIDNRKLRLVLLFLVSASIVATAIYVVSHHQYGVNRQVIRQLQEFIRSFGSWSPLAVISLIIVSTAVPPLPLPVPLIEIAAGLVFGFWKAFLVVWIGQISSSLLAFYLVKLFSKKFLGRVLENRTLNTYRQYLSKKSAQAVFITRFTMASPFNVISYLAGLTHMKVLHFTVATALGTIPEVALYSYIGSRLRGLSISLWYIFLITAVVGLVGFLFTLLTVRLIQPTLQPEDNK